MIQELFLMVAGYVMFRYVEVFCKRPDGQYSRAGFVVMISPGRGPFSCNQPIGRVRFLASRDYRSLAVLSYQL